MTEAPKKKKSGGKRHKAKGDAFERELAQYLNDRLWPMSTPPQVYRTPLSGSFSLFKGVGGADLTGTPGLWVEAKRTETIRPHEFLAQARRGSTAHGSVDMPVVISRRNKQSIDDSLVLMNLKDFVELYRRWCLHAGYINPKQFLPPHAVPEAPTAADPAQGQLPLAISFNNPRPSETS